MLRLENLRILGDGQIWDLKGISPETKDKAFEDIFSGRALARMAQEANQQPLTEGFFSPFKEKGRITGLSVTKALLSNNKKARGAAKSLLDKLAKNGARGIAALNRGKGLKASWSDRERNYWRGLDFVIIGGGVSEELTGRILVGAIRKYLSREGLSDIKISQAKFPGKEAGFLGAVISVIREICGEAKAKGLKVIAASGLDLGRDEIGAGLLAIDPLRGKVLKEGNRYWLLKSAVKTPYKSYLKNFLDSRRDYSAKERKLGERIRRAILEEMADLIIRVQGKALRIGLECAKDIGVAVPGSTSADGYIINSTDYLPFFRKEDGFNFKIALEGSLLKKGIRGYRIHTINDGIAAGIANIYFSSSFIKVKGGRFAFLGVGSGLGGCVGLKSAR